MFPGLLAFILFVLVNSQTVTHQNFIHMQFRLFGCYRRGVSSPLHTIMCLYFIESPIDPLFHRFIFLLYVCLAQNDSQHSSTEE